MIGNKGRGEEIEFRIYFETRPVRIAAKLNVRELRVRKTLQ